MLVSSNFLNYKNGAIQILKVVKDHRKFGHNLKSDLFVAYFLVQNYETFLYLIEKIYSTVNLINSLDLIRFYLNNLFTIFMLVYQIILISFS